MSFDDLDWQPKALALLPYALLGLLLGGAICAVGWLLGEAFGRAQ